MRWKDEGYLLFKTNFTENSIIIEAFTLNHGKCRGIVYGGNSSKKKLIYQIGYFIEYSILQKNKNISPSFNAEITKPFIGPVIKDQFKSYSLLSIISLINISIIEGQRLNGLYKSIKDIVEIISSKKKWISFFCNWLFVLLRIIGYQIDYNNKTSYKYFDLFTQEFKNTLIEDSIVFPHEMLEHKNKANFNDVNAAFVIFESIYSKNHLDNINYKMPINFTNFRNKILNKLKDLK